MTMMQAIWWISLFMAILAVVIMMGLILRRLVIQRRKVWWDTRKKELSGVVFEHMEDPTSIDAISDSFSDKDLRLIHEIAHDLMGSVSGMTKSNLLKILVRVGGLESAISSVRSNNERLRFNAIDNLVLFDDPKAVEVLKEILDDPYPRIRLAAAGALVKKGVHLSVKTLIDKLSVDNGVRPRLLREVFRKIAPNSVDEMLEILKTDVPESIRELLIDALGAANDYTAVDILAAEMTSASVNIRAEAMRSLAAIGHPSALPAVIAGLKDDAWEVRTQAAICAGRIGLSETLPHLVPLLDDEQWWSRYRAAGAIIKMGPEGISKLREISKGLSPAAEIANLVLAEANQT